MFSINYNFYTLIDKKVTKKQKLMNLYTSCYYKLFSVMIL